MFTIKTYDDFNSFIDSLLIHTNSEVENFQLQSEELNKRDLQINGRKNVIEQLMKNVNAYKLSQNYNELIINMTSSNLDELEKKIIPFENIFKEIDSRCICYESQKFSKFKESTDYIREDMYSKLLELSLFLKTCSYEWEELILESNIQLKPLLQQVTKTKNLNVCHLLNKQLEVLQWLEEQLYKISFQLNDIQNVQSFINRGAINQK